MYGCVRTMLVGFGIGARYKVNLDWAVKRFPFTTGHDGIYSPKNVKVLGIHNGGLMMHWRSRGLYIFI